MLEACKQTSYSRSGTVFSRVNGDLYQHFQPAFGRGCCQETTIFLPFFVLQLCMGITSGLFIIYSWRSIIIIFLEGRNLLCMILDMIFIHFLQGFNLEERELSVLPHIQIKSNQVKDHICLCCPNSTKVRFKLKLENS